MKLATTTCDFNRFSSTYQEKINTVIEEGFKYIDLILYNIYKNDELLVSNDWQNNAKYIDADSRLREPQLFMQKHPEKLMYDMVNIFLKAMMYLIVRRNFNGKALQ